MLLNKITKTKTIKIFSQPLLTENANNDDLALGVERGSLNRQYTVNA